jgi:hypothetical protein
MSELAKKFMHLFQGYASAHGTHGVPERDRDGVKWSIKRTAVTLRQSVSEDLWEQHLSGQRPLGVIPIREDSTCSWGGIDYDQYEVNPLDVVKNLISRKLPLVPTRSKSGGVHLWLFVDKNEPAEAVQAALRESAASLGMAGSEIFPKQSHVLAERGDLGNWIIMPYFGSTYSGSLHEQVGLRETGAALSAEEFLAEAERTRVPLADFMMLCRPRPRQDIQDKEARKKEPFSDGPPCLQHLAREGFAKGGRNNALFMIGLYLRRADPLNWADKLDEVNRELFRPPLPSDEIVQVRRQLERKSYEYTCSTEPMASHCDSIVCRTRRYGVGDGGLFPRISGLSKLNTDPPVWFVDVEDARLELSTEQLQLYPLFHRACLERVHRCYRQMAQKDWLQVLSQAIQSLVIIETSPDVSRGAVFTEVLEDFLTNKQRGQTKEDLLSGRPWYNPEGDRHYFRLRDLQKRLDRENYKATRGQITGRIEELKGGKEGFNVKGHFTNVWYVPGSAVRTLPSSDVPPVPGRPM